MTEDDPTTANARPSARARVLSVDDVARLWEPAIAPAIRERAAARELLPDLDPDAAVAHVGRMLLEGRGFLVAVRAGEGGGRLDVAVPIPPRAVEVLQLWSSPDLDEDDAREIGEAAAEAIRSEALRRLAAPTKEPRGRLRRALRKLRKRMPMRIAALVLALGFVVGAEVAGAARRYIEARRTEGAPPPGRGPLEGAAGASKGWTRRAS